MYGHWSTKSHSWLKIYTHLITIMLCNFFRNTLFYRLLVRWRIVKKYLPVEADAASVFMCGNETNWWTTQNELFCVTLLQHSQAAAISILITTLEILMAVLVYLNNLQHSGCFTKLEVCLSTTVLYVYEVHSWAVHFYHTKEGLLPYSAIDELIHIRDGVCFLHFMISIIKYKIT